MTRRGDTARPNSRASNRGNSAARIGLFAACCVLAFTATILAIDRGLSALGLQSEFPINLDLIQSVDVWREAISNADRDPEVRPWALIGDSLTMSARSKTKEELPALPDMLETALRENHPELRMLALHWGGLGPTEVYYLADEIVDSGVRNLILALNLASLSPDWALWLNRSEISGWVSPRRIPGTLLMPLHKVGLSADRFLWYSGMHNLGLTDLWYRVVQFQVRAKSAPQILAERADEIAGGNFQKRRSLRQIKLALERDTIPGADRLTRRGVLTKYAPVLAGIDSNEPPLRFLVGALRTFRRANIRATVVAMPVNLDHWRDVGALDDVSGLRRTIATLHRRITETGAVFIDLHDLLPDSAFRDKADHFTFGGPDSGTGQVAKAIAAALHDFEGNGS